MIGLANPWVLLGLLIGALTLAGGGYWKGSSDANARCDVRISEMTAKAQEAKDAEAAKAATAAQELETQNAQAQALYRRLNGAVNKLASRDDYRGRDCLEPDGLRLVTDAFAGTLPATSKPADTMPSPPSP